MAAAGDLAFVTCQNGDALSLIDLGTRAELRRIPLPGKPAGIAVAADGSFYAVSADSKTLRHLDREGALLAERVLDGGPIGVALDPATGHVFVSDWYNARIWVLDAATLAPVTELETGAAPAGLAVWGGLLASADRDGDMVSVFDLGTLALLHRIPVGTRPFGLGFAPDGRLFAGNVGSNDVTVMDPREGTVIATLPVGERPYGVAFAAGRAFVTNQYADSVSVIDLATLDPVATIEVGEYPEGIDTAGGMVVVANWFENTVTLIDAATLEVAGAIGTADGPRAFGQFILEGSG
nr:YncE family protein [Poseidonocella sp. HB161398]